MLEGEIREFALLSQSAPVGPFRWIVCVQRQIKMIVEIALAAHQCLAAFFAGGPSEVLPELAALVYESTIRQLDVLLSFTSLELVEKRLLCLRRQT